MKMLKHVQSINICTYIDLILLAFNSYLVNDQKSFKSFVFRVIPLIKKHADEN